MTERTINWGPSEADAKYQSGTEPDGDGGENYVVARDLDGGQILLEYDDATDSWECVGNMNIDGGLSAITATISNSPSDPEDVARLEELDEKADLTSSGVVVSEQIPNLAITQTFTVADESERLSLDVEEGDIAIQDDNDTTYIFTGGDPSDDSDWSTIVFNVVAEIAGRTIEPDALSGGVIDQDNDVTVLRDIHVTEEGASDPRSGGGELWLEYES